VSKGTNRKFDARITLEQLLALYTDPESHNAQRYRQTDRRTDGQQAAANSRSYCVAVRSAKNGCSYRIMHSRIWDHAMQLSSQSSPMTLV